MTEETYQQPLFEDIEQEDHWVRHWQGMPHFHSEQDVAEFDAILKHCFMSKRPVAILTDANFWNGY